MSTNRGGGGPPADLLAAADRSLLAEVGWCDPSGRWSAAVVVPLVHDGVLTIALPYAERPLARALGRAGELLVVCSDARLGLRGWRAVAGLGTAVLEEDADGARFTAGLLEDELRKHPPARLLADSPMLRREHWWYLPRLLLHVRPRSCWAVAARTTPREEGVLFATTAQGAHADTVAVEDRGVALRLTSLAGAPALDAGAAALLRHDAALPDLEQRSRLLERGRVAAGLLTVEERTGALELPPPDGLLARYRRARAFERACRRELGTAGDR